MLYVNVLLGNIFLNLPERVVTPHRVNNRTRLVYYICYYYVWNVLTFYMTMQYLHLIHTFPGLHATRHTQQILIILQLIKKKCGDLLLLHPVQNQQRWTPSTFPDVSGTWRIKNHKQKRRKQCTYAKCDFKERYNALLVYVVCVFILWICCLYVLMTFPGKVVCIHRSTACCYIRIRLYTCVQ